MIKLLIVILYLASAASTLDMSEDERINYTKIYMELPPAEANKFATEVGLSKEDRAAMKLLWFFTELMGIFNGISKKDMAVVKETIWTTSSRRFSSEEFLAELTKKSPDLGARIKNMRDLDKKQLAELKPEAQAFAENITEFMWNSKFFDEHKAMSPSVADELTLGAIEKFNALSDDAKENIKEKIPALAAFLKSEETTKRLQEQ